MGPWFQYDNIRILILIRSYCDPDRIAIRSKWEFDRPEWDPHEIRMGPEQNPGMIWIGSEYGSGYVLMRFQ